MQYFRIMALTACSQNASITSCFDLIKQEVPKGDWAFFAAGAHFSFSLDA